LCTLFCTENRRFICTILYWMWSSLAKSLSKSTSVKSTRRSLSNAEIQLNI
jgi:hypothetical protein